MWQSINILLYSEKYQELNNRCMIQRKYHIKELLGKLAYTALKNGKIEYSRKGRLTTVCESLYNNLNIANCILASLITKRSKKYTFLPFEINILCRLYGAIS